MFFKIISLLFFIQSSFQSEFYFSNYSPFKTVFKRQFSVFDVWIDCKERIPVLFNYKAEKDNGSLPQSSKFQLDQEVSPDCQQWSYSTYANSGYDRGHMVSANHLDYSDLAIVE